MVHNILTSVTQEKAPTSTDSQSSPPPPPPATVQPPSTVTHSPPPPPARDTPTSTHPHSPTPPPAIMTAALECNESIRSLDNPDLSDTLGNEITENLN